jgi:hypothetical protein
MLEHGLCCAVPGYAQQMVPAQGVSASSHAFGPAAYGVPHTQLAIFDFTQVHM